MILGELVNIEQEMAKRLLKRFHTLLRIADDHPVFVMTEIEKSFLSKRSYSDCESRIYALGMLTGLIFWRLHKNLTLSQIIELLKTGPNPNSKSKPDPSRPPPFQFDFDVTNIEKEDTKKPDNAS